MPHSGPKEPAASGRPSMGGLMKDAYRLDVWRRETGRDLKPLRRLLPFVFKHWPDALLGLVFVVVSSAAILGLPYTMKLAIDHGFENRAVLSEAFEALAVGAVVL